MKKRYNILLVCAMGYSTSSLIKLQIRRFLDQNNIDADLHSSALNTIQNHLDDTDLIVTSLDLNPEDYSIPVVNAVDLISGRNKDKIFAEIQTALEKSE
ncbi:MAG TPA: hypothetical protein DDZ66_02000 [Firmicutes bacterium]|nr:hypothetical protein [Bacillota bacterium]